MSQADRPSCKLRGQATINWKTVMCEMDAIRWVHEYRAGECSSPAVQAALDQLMKDTIEYFKKGGE